MVCYSKPRKADFYALTLALISLIMHYITTSTRTYGYSSVKIGYNCHTCDISQFEVT